MIPSIVATIGEIHWIFEEKALHAPRPILICSTLICSTCLLVLVRWLPQIGDLVSLVWVGCCRTGGWCLLAVVLVVRQAWYERSSSFYDGNNVLLGSLVGWRAV